MMNNDYLEVDSVARYNALLPSLLTDQGDDQLWQSENATTPASCPEQYSLDPFPIVQARNVRTSRSATSLSAARQSRVSKQPATRTHRQRKPRTPNLVTPELTAPLSILTQDMSIPLKDIEAYVNRSIEDRRAEAEKRNGHVPRPMNSFMLYRSAYAERTKQWCLQNKHQVVSAVSGESWPMEPPEVRNKFNEWADIERANHQSAHPNYKFSPSKAVSNKSMRDGRLNDDDSSPVDIGHCEEDFEYGNANQFLKHPGSERHIPRSVWPRQLAQQDVSLHLQVNNLGSQPYGNQFNNYTYERSPWNENTGHDYSQDMSYQPFQQYSPFAMYPSQPLPSTPSSMPATHTSHLSPNALNLSDTHSMNYHDPPGNLPGWTMDGVYSHAGDFHTPTAFLDPTAITIHGAPLQGESMPASSTETVWDQPEQTESPSTSSTAQQLREHRRHARMDSQTHGILDPSLDMDWSAHVAGGDGVRGSVIPMEEHFENAIESLDSKGV